MGFTRPKSSAAATKISETPKKEVPGKVYPTFDLHTKDEEGKLVRLCGLFQKVDKKGRPMWVGNSDTHVFFLFRNDKTGLSLHVADQVAKGAPRPEITRLVEKFYDNESKKGTTYQSGKDSDGNQFLIFKYTPKEA
jgi:hypothetical protein